eukprot:TRINITY_DN9064_c0_g1_i1.p1 TRINITY_DN9064_c0_g1~~TRINITY_DN9064_c0_g1_i1.p1  ORF type:complete len:587 (-),score=106.79 TRINITY_DN9064_c0_g1_i1:64-1824(-)
MNENERRESIICSICHLTLKDPRSLPCNHHFCRECLVPCFWNGECYCPIDKQRFPVPEGVDSLPSNPELENTIASLLEQKSSLKYQISMQLLKEMSNKLKSSQSSVFCQGAVKYASTLFVKSYPKNITFPIAPETAQEIYQLGQAATFGKGKEEVYDPTVRLAVAFKSTDFALNFHPSMSSIIDEIHKNLLFEKDLNAFSIRAQPYRLNIYGKGGHFKYHEDTPQLDTHFGSLVICLPSKFSGGQFGLEIPYNSKIEEPSTNVKPYERSPYDPPPRVRRRNNNENQNQNQNENQGTEEKETLVTNFSVDWAPKSGEGDSLQWCAFFSDVGHEIFTVTEGFRFTVTYHLYCTPRFQEVDRPFGSSLDVTQTPLYKDFFKVLYCPGFFPSGVKLAFGLLHKYPLPDPEKFDKNNLIVSLKGRDSLLFRVLSELKQPVELKSVYVFLNEDIMYQENQGIQAFSKRFPYEMLFTTKKHEVYFLANDFNKVGRLDEHRSRQDMIREDANGEISEGLIWCIPPGSKSFVNSYIPEGNEPSLYATYVWAALLVEVPPFHVRMQLLSQQQTPPQQQQQGEGSNAQAKKRSFQII